MMFSIVFAKMTLELNLIKLVVSEVDGFVAFTKSNDRFISLAIIVLTSVL